MAFYAQHQLESLNVENEILQELMQAGSKKLEVELRTILGSFLFTGDEVYKKIKVLSGGEKSRVALAKTLISEANFLMLDEPTNHLDMQSVNILIQALEQYEGTFVVISHDRYFVENVANKIWYIEDFQLKEYPGTYHEFEIFQEKREKERKKQEQQQPQQSSSKKSDQPKSNSQQNFGNELKAAQRQLEKLEQEVSELEQQQVKLETELAKPEVFGNPDKLLEVTSSFEKVKQQLEQKQEAWEEQMLTIEELESKMS
ncbi:MAG: ATP-binding cassette domain-containing protein [Hymenobacteraceae bacterium]|nr:ATP-binding cassette domain-containing protein [Hymenobacteraceae bacterium]MDX5397522.1 ATP-binding cassette domain-containing protein [Hymenobacteraceae bacterium]MDX5513601.1 ATP-binding cassette domain-containing protein [Hymenobacteraceae bacterium]